MSNEHSASIAALERKLEELEQKSSELKGAINVLCEVDGLPPRYPDTSAKSPVSTQIRDDTFYGKRQQTAAREYLDMRHAQSLGPAKPREIFEALKSGGYQFQAKDDETSLVGLRAMLRKRTSVFHKLPTGSYGLVSWYGDIKPQKAEDASQDDEDILDDDDEVTGDEAEIHSDPIEHETADDE